MKNFIEQISIKFGKSRWIWYKLCCRQAHQNIGKIIGENLYIGRYSTDQITVDRYIGRSLVISIKRSVYSMTKNLQQWW